MKPNELVAGWRNKAKIIHNFTAGTTRYNKMPTMTYTAAKSRTQNRPGWSVTFRHPLRNDARGKPGLKMRRGLGTAVEAEADLMVDEMNTLLGDASWWNADRRQDAELRFSKPVVAAFYDEIQAGREDSNPDDYSIGVKAGIEACADGLELEIKRSNFVSLNSIEESILENELWSQFPCDNVRGVATYLLQRYHIIKK